MKAGPALAKYFNTDNDPEGYTKKPAGQFAMELKELDPADKQELGQAACDEMGIEFTPAT